MKEKHPRYSIVIPAFNEASRIRETIGRLVSFFGNKQSGFEIIVVDDGSADRTTAIAQEADTTVRVLTNSSNMGKGFSVKRGILAAKGEFVLFTDTDLSVPVEQFNRILKPLEEGKNVVISSRRHPDSRICAYQPRSRVLMGVLFNFIVRVMLLGDLYDTQCGLKGFSRRASREIFSRIMIAGWCFDVESLVIARELGHEITEAPVDWADSGATRLRPWSAFREIARDIPTIYFRRRRGCYERIGESDLPYPADGPFSAHDQGND